MITEKFLNDTLRSFCEANVSGTSPDGFAAMVTEHVMQRRKNGVVKESIVVRNMRPAAGSKKRRRSAVKSVEVEAGCEPKEAAAEQQVHAEEAAPGGAVFKTIGGGEARMSMLRKVIEDEQSL